jgi:signal peptidase I
MGTPALMGCTPVEFESLCTMELATVSTLVKEIPAYLLHISLTGRFWDEIALVLAQRAVNGHAETREKPFKPAKKFYQSGLPEPAIDLFGAGHIPIVYSGPSMNPTLQAPDLLDVVPYDGGQPAVGDVICFIPPGDEKIVVHRIIRITGSGIQTQGDNNPSADTALFQENRIIGRVIGATRGNHPKRIASGNQVCYNQYIQGYPARKTGSCSHTGILSPSARQLEAPDRTLLVPEYPNPEVVLRSICRRGIQYNTGYMDDPVPVPAAGQ